MNELKSMLAEHPFLRGMSARHLGMLARHAREVEFEADQVIFREGEPAYQFYLLRKGRVAIEAYVPKDGHFGIQTLGPGEVLGWSWLFPPYCWHFQARALEPVAAIFLDGARLLVECEKEPALGYDLMKRMAQVIIQRLQATRHCLVDRARQTPPVPAEGVLCPNFGGK